MKIVAINGSPRGADGNTEQILQPFLAGAREAGAQTEVVYLKEKRIEHCMGCFTCWTSTPGVCIHEDDMAALLEKIRDVDVLVFATPLYVFTVSGLMKDFMDRMLPLAQPFILKRGQHFVHPTRYPRDKPTKYVVISNAGFPERHHFSALEETFRRLTDSPEDDLAGMICCAGGELFRQPEMRESLAWYVDATRQAGREIVERGHISSETLAVLDRPLVDDPAAYANAANAWWESFGIEGIGLDSKERPVPSPVAKGRAPLAPPEGQDTMRDLIAGMATVFNPKEAGDLKAVVQFEVTGQEPGEYYLDMAQGHCTAYEGKHTQPMLTIHTPSQVWMAISRGELNSAMAMMAGKYSVKGDFGLLTRFSRLFAPASE
jgi:putative sterol carrier protein/putative NADPH-quinone reductase